MKQEHKEAIEKIIAEFKNDKTGKMYVNNYYRLIPDNDLRILITKTLVNELELIEQTNSNFYRLTSKGWNFTTYKEIEDKEQATKEKERIEFEKTKIDLELARKMLKEYPCTKWSARIGLLLAVSLAILEFVKYIQNK